VLGIKHDIIFNQESSSKDLLIFKNLVFLFVLYFKKLKAKYEILVFVFNRQNNNVFPKALVTVFAL
jgi:hypothetical protein